MVWRHYLHTLLGQRASGSAEPDFFEGMAFPGICSYSGKLTGIPEGGVDAETPKLLSRWSARGRLPLPPVSLSGSSIPRIYMSRIKEPNYFADEFRLGKLLRIVSELRPSVAFAIRWSIFGAVSKVLRRLDRNGRTI